MSLGAFEKSFSSNSLFRTFHSTHTHTHTRVHKEGNLIVVTIKTSSKIRIELRTNGTDCVIERRRVFGRNSIQESSVDELFQEKLDISQLRVLDAERLEHAQVAILNSHKDGTKMLQIGSHQMQCCTEICERDDGEQKEKKVH